MAGVTVSSVVCYFATMTSIRAIDYVFHGKIIAPILVFFSIFIWALILQWFMFYLGFSSFELDGEP